MSWHKKDWLKKFILPAAAIAGAAYTGGSSLGLLGAAETGAGAAAGAGSGLLGTDFAALGLGPLAEMGPGGAAGMGSGLTAADYAAIGKGPGLLGGLSNLNWDKGLKGLQLANQFTQQGQPEPVQQTVRPQAPQINSSADLEKLKKLYAQIYGGLYV